MNEDFATFELARKLKEKGFNKECFAHYDDLGNLLLDKDYWKLDSHILAPTIFQVLKWLRKENAIHIDIVLWEKGWYSDVWCFEYYEEEKEYACKKEYQSNDCNSYEEAALAGIEYVIDNLI